MIARRHQQEEPPPAKLATFTVTLTMKDGRQVAHKSMAGDWTGAVELALRSVRRDGIASRDEVPETIVVARG